MANILNFFNEVGRLKEMPRRGWVLRGIKNPESIADHSFRVSMMAWVLGKQKHNLNLEKIIKMALAHDLCEVYAGDITPYDSVLPKDTGKRKEMLKTWPKFTEAQKKNIAQKKYKKEKDGLEKLVRDLPVNLAKEVKSLWLDYEKRLSPESRFLRQIDRAENLLQSLEYWEKNKNLPQKAWWIQASQLFDDKIMIELSEQMDKTFHKTHKPKH